MNIIKVRRNALPDFRNTNRAYVAWVDGCTGCRAHGATKEEAIKDLHDRLLRVLNRAGSHLNPFYEAEISRPARIRTLACGLCDNPNCKGGLACPAR